MRLHLQRLRPSRSLRFAHQVRGALVGHVLRVDRIVRYIRVDKNLRHRRVRTSLRHTRVRSGRLRPYHKAPLEATCDVRARQTWTFTGGLVVRVGIRVAVPRAEGRR